MIKLSSSYYPFRVDGGKVTYQKTFLQSVLIKFNYDNSRETYDSFRDFMQNIFSLDFSENEFLLKSADAFRIKSEDNAIRIRFKEGNVEITLAGKEYHNFEKSALPAIHAVSGYVSSVSDSIRNLSVEKIDIWPLLNQALSFKKEELVKAILSEEMLEKGGMPLNETANVGFIDSGNKDVLLIKYGIIDKIGAPDPQPTRIILDSICLHSACIAPDLTAETLTRLNDVLYHAYHWAVTDEVIQVMTK